MSTKKDKTRVEFGLSSFSIENKTSVYVLIFIIVILGLLSYNNMPRESFPEIVQPTIYVNTAYPGNSPSDMENLVTRPIEKEIKTLKNVKKFTSTSIQDFSIIIVEFESDKDTKQALQEVKDKVDKAKKDLPNDLPVPPNVFEMDFSEFPVMNINLSGKFSYNEFKEYAEYLRDEIEKIPEISEVAIRGLLTKEVEISVDLPAMEAVQVNFDDIEMAIRNENLSMSAGDILSISGAGLDRRSIRITGEFKNPIEMENIIVKNENQMPVYLRDIAKVSFGPVEPISFARMDGNAVVMLDVKKKSGENLINGAKKIREVLQNAKKTKLPSNLSIIVTNDQSIDTEMMVSNLENNIISGVILVVLVLLFFLGIRNAIFVGVAIPLSMILGIFILNFMGTTLNMMVLFSLILALGMLVDNGIVVVENIYRLRSEGHNKINASKFGVGEVAKPIISSTATTLAAFLPLLFWDSIIGEFMKYLPITLIITLSASLFVGLVVNPVLTANFIKISKPGERSSIRKFWRNTAIMFALGLVLFFAGGGMRIVGNLLMVFALLSILFRFILLPVSENFQYGLIPRIENRYKKFVHWALTRWRPYFIFIGTFFLLIFSTSFYFGSNPKTTFFPENDPKYVNVYVEMPLGKDIRQTDSITKVFEKRITDALVPNKAAVEAIIAQVGEGTSDPNSGPSLGASPHKARITVSFIKYEDRIKVTNVTTTQMMEDIRNAVQGFPEANVSVEKNTEGPPVGPPINIEVIGENYDTLIALSNRVKEYLTKANVPGVDRLKTDLELGKPETIVKINNEAARLYGISTYYIAAALRTGLFGKEISKYKEGEDDYPIQLRLKNQYRYNIESLMNMRVTFRNQTNGQIVQIPISSVATIEQSSSYGSVKRKDMDRVISIFSNVQPGANANEIIAEYKQLMADFKMPDTYIYKFTGEQEEQNDSVAFMVQALLIAVFLIFLIIVTQFNSIISPFIIMFSVLFSTIGVFIGFGIFKMDFVFLMCGIGIISLAGVVVNNAIVLLDYTNLLRSRRREELGLEENEYLTLPDLIDTITEAGKTRLRPVLLTAITTVLGLIPLAIGLNINFITLLSHGDPQIFIGGDSVAFWGPMSWTVIFGLIFATFLTLVVVPVMYYLSDRLVLLVKRIL